MAGLKCQGGPPGLLLLPVLALMSRLQLSRGGCLLWACHLPPADQVLGKQGLRGSASVTCSAPQLPQSLLGPPTWRVQCCCALVAGQRPHAARGSPYCCCSQRRWSPALTASRHVTGTRSADTGRLKWRGRCCCAGCGGCSPRRSGTAAPSPAAVAWHWTTWTTCGHCPPHQTAGTGHPEGGALQGSRATRIAPAPAAARACRQGRRRLHSAAGVPWRL
mmetsp:Transcript_34739/g.77253  ORF Transcript_34739/g.77253 Transcript_34739/m.77253 type:complete len:219 (+) Transcript_34739:1999-2655(+)